jgi:hypothetical protein
MKKVRSPRLEVRLPSYRRTECGRRNTGEVVVLARYDGQLGS